MKSKLFAIHFFDPVTWDDTSHPCLHCYASDFECSPLDGVEYACIECLKKCKCIRLKNKDVFFITHLPIYDDFNEITLDS